MTFIFDCEVFAFDWLFVFKDLDSGEYTVIHNDNEAVKDYAVVVQSIGRIARTFDGKDSPIVYDFVDNIGYLMRAYKQRCRHYRKAGAYFIEKGEPLHGN